MISRQSPTLGSADGATAAGTQHVFLGWDRPLLPAASEWLIEHADRFATSPGFTAGDRSLIDLTAVLCIVPGRRAGRRLLLELHDRSQELGRSLLPPVITSPGPAVDQLLSDIETDDDRAIADPWTIELAWIDALRSTDHDMLAPLFPHPPANDDWIAWFHLAQTITTLHDTLAGARLSFVSVTERAERLEFFQEGDRWRALTAVHEGYRLALDRLHCMDRHDHREMALTSWRRGTARLQPVLIGVVELNALQRAVLRRTAESTGVVAIVHAPSDFRDRFDDQGCVSREAWDDVAVDDRLATVRFADRPLDQAQAALLAVAELDGTCATDEITIALGDPSLSGPLTRATRWAGLDLHDAAGHPLDRSTPFRLLQLLADWVSESRLDTFAAMIRHCDLERWLRRQVGDDADRALTLLDKYRATHLQQCITGRWIGNATERRQIASLHDAVHTLTAPLHEPARPVHQWCAPIRDILAGIYSQALEQRPRTRSAQRRERAIDAILHHLAMLESVRSPLEPEADASTALRMLTARLTGERTPDDLRHDQIEMVGWLEMHADPSPALIITGFNDGCIPSAAGADLFLPNAMRQVLGLPDNQSRYARDAYFVAAAQHSHRHVTIIAGRRAVSGDPFTPSRLLLSGDDDQLVRRARLLFNEHAASTVDRPAGLPRPARDVRFIVPPLPEYVPPPRCMSVTDFKAYIDCPYRYALSRLLGFERLADDARELDALSFGSLLHKTLHEYGSDRSLRSATDEQKIRAALLGMLNDVAADHLGSDPPTAVRIQFQMMRQRLIALAAQQAQWCADGWEILHTELDVSEAVALDVPGDEPMPLRAKIDRIDVNASTGAFRIIDYKSGDTPKTPHQAHHGDRKSVPVVNELQWTDLQLPLYEYIARAAGIIDGPGAELGYILLPKDSSAVTFAPAGWTAEHLADALDFARQIVCDIRAGKFEPNPDFSFDDEFARLCHTRFYHEPGADEADEGADA